VTKFQSYLRKNIGACHEARQWADERTAREAWDECERADWLLWWVFVALGNDAGYIYAATAYATALRRTIEGTSVEMCAIVRAAIRFEDLGYDATMEAHNGAKPVRAERMQAELDAYQMKTQGNQNEILTLYVYDTATREVVAEISGETNAACERVAADQYGDTDRFAATYSPAFGAADGLIATADCDAIDFEDVA
jgi:hypothetical protein